MTPEYPPTHPVSELEDGQILERLADLRTTAAATDGADDATIEAIAELELEVARRGLDAPAVRERVPPAFALERFKAAYERSDLEAAGRAIFEMDAPGVWYAYRRAKEVPDVVVRLYLLDRIHFCIEAGVHGAERAQARRNRLVHSPLDGEDLAAYLVQLIDALLTVSIINLDLPY
jgi:hypothetical protein